MNEDFKNYLRANKYNYTPTFTNILLRYFFTINGKAIIAIYYVLHHQNYLSNYLRFMLKRKFHIEIGNNIKAGKNLMFPHPRNITIASEVQIGDDCQINQNVTIGGNMRKTKQREWGMQKLPIIKDKVVLYTGCVVAGPAIIGSNCLIGANAVITHDLEDNTLVYNNCSQSTRKIIVIPGATYQLL